MQFSTLAVGTGFKPGPGSVDDALAVAGEFGGGSDAWSEISFDQPVAASLDGLYVIVEFPAGSAFTGRGEGGGPAVGFSDGLSGPSGWISGDGEQRYRLAGDFGLAVATARGDVLDYGVGRMGKAEFMEMLESLGAAEPEQT